MEIALPTDRLKTFKEQWEVKPHSGSDLNDDRRGTGPDVSEAKVVTGLPDKELGNVKEVDKDARSNPQLIRIEAKQSVTAKDNRTHGRKRKHKGLKPGQDALGKGAIEEKMLKRLSWGSTKAGQGN